MCSSLPTLYHERGYTQSVCGLLGGEARRVGSSRRTLFEEGVFASAPHGAGPLRRSGGCIRGARNWIWQREWRRAGPYLYPHLPDLLPVLWDRKPVLRILPLRGRAQRFTYLPPRRKMWRALIIRPFNPHNTRSY